MIDKLDEIFPRRSTLERTALRGLLRSMRIFASDNIRLKIFLRDDMLTEVVSGSEGFVALTHVTARMADTLRWSEDQILTMIVKRLFSSGDIRSSYGIDKAKLDASLEYRRVAFYKAFPGQVFSGPSQSSTLRWIYNHTADANGVVTPRDVIELLTRAKQHQYNLFSANPAGKSSWLISSQSIRYGLGELSRHKRTTYLQAEFPHLWLKIEKFIDGKTDYDERALKRLLGKNWEGIAKDLCAIGLLSPKGSGGVFKIPHLYRRGLGITQGKA